MLLLFVLCAVLTPAACLQTTATVGEMTESFLLAVSVWSAVYHPGVSWIRSGGCQIDLGGKCRW